MITVTAHSGAGRECQEPSWEAMPSTLVGTQQVLVAFQVPCNISGSPIRPQWISSEPTRSWGLNKEPRIRLSLVSFVA
eukprot:2876024-Rhodomonas_salina.2